VSKPTALGTEEGNFLDGREHPIVGEIDAGKAVLLPSVIHLALGTGIGRAGGVGGEDFAGVIQSFAEGVGGLEGELVPHAGQAQFSLQGMVVGKSRIGTSEQDALVAVDRAHGFGHGSVAGGARGQTRRN